MQDAVTDLIISRVSASLQTLSSSSEEEVAMAKRGGSWAALKFKVAFPSSSHKEKSGVRKADEGTAFRLPT